MSNEMTHHQPYPTSLPEAIECVHAAFKLAREGNFGAEFWKHFYTALGFGFYVVFGDPDHPPMMGSAESKEFLTAVADEVAQTPSEAIPWQILIPLAIQLFQAFWNRRK